MYKFLVTPPLSGDAVTISIESEWSKSGESLIDGPEEAVTELRDYFSRNGSTPEGE
jgi:hypothetical protein